MRNGIVSPAASDLTSRIVVSIAIVAFVLAGCQPPPSTAPEYVAPRLVDGGRVFFYPREAWVKELEGTVILRVRVDLNGYASEAEMLESSGYEVLDNAALTMARTSRFDPGRIGGQVMEMWVNLPIVFELTTVPVFSLNLEEWELKAREYQKLALSDNMNKRRITQKDLFFHYASLARRMVESRSVIPNQTIRAVVTPSVWNLWIEYHEVWPLAFVLFQDFIQRYHESEYVDKAKEQMIDIMLEELERLKDASMGTSSLVELRKQLLDDLMRFLKEHYPDSLPQSLRKTF